MVVDLQEAIRRLNLQTEIGLLNAELTEREVDTFAGLWIQHQPDYRVIVLFTQNGESTLSPYVEALPWKGVIDVRSAQTTLDELRYARSQADGIAERLGIPHVSAINVIDNSAEIFVIGKEKMETMMQRAELTLPNRVIVRELRRMPVNVTDIDGGRSLLTHEVSDDKWFRCTSGFSVSHSSSRGP